MAIDLKRLLDYSKRLQEAHQQAVQAGDKTKASQFGQLIDETQTVAEKAVQEAKQPAAGQHVNLVAPNTPMAPSNAPTMTPQAQPDVIKLMTGQGNTPVQQMTQGVPNAPAPAYTGPAAGLPSDVQRDASLEQQGGMNPFMKWLTGGKPPTGVPEMTQKNGPEANGVVKPGGKETIDWNAVKTIGSMANPMGVWSDLARGTGHSMGELFNPLGLANDVYNAVKTPQATPPPVQSPKTTVIPPAPQAQDPEMVRPVENPNQPYTGSTYDPGMGELNASASAKAATPGYDALIKKYMGDNPNNATFMDALGFLFGGQRWLQAKQQQVADYNNKAFQLGVHQLGLKDQSAASIAANDLKRQEMAISLAKVAEENRHNMATEAAAEDKGPEALQNTVLHGVGSSIMPETVLKTAPYIQAQRDMDEARRRKAALEAQRATVTQGK